VTHNEDMSEDDYYFETSSRAPGGWQSDSPEDDIDEDDEPIFIAGRSTLRDADTALTLLEGAGLITRRATVDIAPKTSEEARRLLMGLRGRGIQEGAARYTVEVDVWGKDPGVHLFSDSYGFARSRDVVEAEAVAFILGDNWAIWILDFDSENSAREVAESMVDALEQGVIAWPQRDVESSTFTLFNELDDEAKIGERFKNLESFDWRVRSAENPILLFLGFDKTSNDNTVVDVETTRLIGVGHAIVSWPTIGSTHQVQLSVLLETTKFENPASRPHPLRTRLDSHSKSTSSHPIYLERENWVVRFDPRFEEDEDRAWLAAGAMQSIIGGTIDLQAL
jgi:hypothetical protein